MADIKLLDCTLRDGGYVNDWQFGHSNLISIYERLASTGVDYVEIGFLDDRRPLDINRSIFPDTSCYRKIWGKAKARPKKVCAMIDYGTCSLEHIEPSAESGIDAIRVIFKQHKLKDAMAFCAEVKKLGYEVFSQLVSVTTYSDEDLVEMCKVVNEVEPAALSMVDTYGLLEPSSLLHIFSIIDDNLKPGITIGFHAHNNFQLAYANCIAFLSRKETRHDILADGTLYGMGKSAGNAPLELLAMQLNEHFGKDYKIDPMLEAIEESIMDFYKKSPWGYKMFFYLSAKNKCHPTYVSDYLKKDNLSITDLDKVLSTIEPEDEKLLYNADTSAKTYTDYMEALPSDEEQAKLLAQELKGRKVLVMGPGKNIKLQEGKVQDFIRTNDPVVISINYVPEQFGADFVFTTKASRYLEMTDMLHEEGNGAIKIIATSNVTSKTESFAYTFNRAPLLEQSEDFKDNSFIMLIKILKMAGIKTVYCAGLDGYSTNESNYYNPKMEYSFVKNYARYLNRHMHDCLYKENSDMTFEFVTYSVYTEEEDSHDAAF
ncbi:MAG: aldolase catalytic domain-containing protein [Saccharofermentans sp.]|nr:aldolase catalytic domain-containing protein [Saccharofermentans sp.]